MFSRRGRGTAQQRSRPYPRPPVEYDAKPPAASPRVEQTAMDPVSWWSVVKNRVQPWLPEIVLVWFAGVLVLALRPLLSWHTVRRLRNGGRFAGTRCGAKPAGADGHAAGGYPAVEVLQSTLVRDAGRPGVLSPCDSAAAVCGDGPAGGPTGIDSGPRTGPYSPPRLPGQFAPDPGRDAVLLSSGRVVALASDPQRAGELLRRRGDATVGSRADYGRALLAIAEMRAASPRLSLAARRRIAPGPGAADRRLRTGSAHCRRRPLVRDPGLDRGIRRRDLGRPGGEKLRANAGSRRNRCDRPRRRCGGQGHRRRLGGRGRSFAEPGGG